MVVVEGRWRVLPPPTLWAWPGRFQRARKVAARRSSMLPVVRPTDDVLGLAWGNGFVVVQAAGESEEGRA